jgi:hypothetical protein
MTTAEGEALGIQLSVVILDQEGRSRHTMFESATVPLHCLRARFPEFVGHIGNVLRTIRDICTGVTCMMANGDSTTMDVTLNLSTATTETWSCCSTCETSPELPASAFAFALLKVIEQCKTVHRKELGPHCLPVQVMLGVHA